MVYDARFSTHDSLVIHLHDGSEDTRLESAVIPVGDAAFVCSTTLPVTLTGPVQVSVWVAYR